MKYQLFVVIKLRYKSQLLTCTVAETAWGS